MLLRQWYLVHWGYFKKQKGGRDLTFIECLLCLGSAPSQLRPSFPIIPTSLELAVSLLCLNMCVHASGPLHVLSPFHVRVFVSLCARPFPVSLGSPLLQSAYLSTLSEFTSGPGSPPLPALVSQRMASPNQLHEPETQGSSLTRPMANMSPSPLRFSPRPWGSVSLWTWLQSKLRLSCLSHAHCLLALHGLSSIFE